MARLSFTSLVLLSLALLSAPVFAQDRKLLQQVNVPVTVQCVNLLNNNQIGNIPNLNAGVVQLIVSLIGGGAQQPTALFFNSGTSKNQCRNKQEFNNYSNCGSVIGPLVVPVLGQGTLIPCYGSGGNDRKLLQQVNVPVTAQCINALDNNQILNVANADVQVIGAILSLLSAGGAQSPSAAFFNFGSANNKCKNNQEFNNQANCGSVIGPIVLPVAGQAWVTPCYDAEEPDHHRKLLQQVNVPITVQCINLLNNNQILNIPNLNVGIIQAIVGVLSGGGQTPTALFFNSGNAKNKCSNNQEFNNESNCGSIIGPIVLPILGQGTLIPCYGN